jgi:hypothetical protein
MSRVPPNEPRTDDRALIDDHAGALSESTERPGKSGEKLGSGDPSAEKSGDVSEQCRPSSNADFKQEESSSSASEVREAAEESDWQLFENAIKQWNNTVASLTSPERIARYAKYNDDPITKREGFIAAAVLPGEDFEECKDFVAHLCSDLQLEGSVEQRLGLVLASYLWRLDHLDIFDRAQRARAKYAKYFDNPSRHAWRLAQIEMSSHWHANWIRKMVLDDEEEGPRKLALESLRLTRESKEMWDAMKRKWSSAKENTADNPTVPLPADQIQTDPEGSERRGGRF